MIRYSSRLSTGTAGRAGATRLLLVGRTHLFTNLSGHGEEIRQLLHGNRIRTEFANASAGTQYIFE